MNTGNDDRLAAVTADVAARCPAPGSIWRHRKGGLYVVSSGAVIEATLTPAVVYRGVEWYPFSTCWVRPLDEFLDGRFTEERE